MTDCEKCKGSGVIECDHFKRLKNNSDFVEKIMPYCSRCSSVKSNACIEGMTTCHICKGSGIGFAKNVKKHKQLELF